MAALGTAPALDFDRSGPLPYLVEFWYLGPAATRYMVERRFRAVLERADLKPGQRVLDVGCGWAYGTHWARTLGCRVSGVDLGLDQLGWARRSLPDAADLGLVQANARALPFRDATFDRAFSVEMLEHVYRPDRDRVLAEIARVLKPGGRLALSTPNTTSPIEVAKRALVHWPAVRRRLPSACFPEAREDADTYHPYRYHYPMALGELRARLATAGFRVLGSQRFLWVLKVLPDGLLGPARAAEWLAERTPGVSALGATSMVWAERV